MESVTRCGGLAALLVAFGLSGCGAKRELGEVDAGAGKLGSGEAPDDTTMIDLLAGVSRCDIYHRGQLMDLGSPTADSRFGFDLAAPAGIQSTLRDGATWAQTSTRNLSQSFYLDQATPVFVSARIRGVASKTATVRIDGKAVGTLSFRRGDTEVASTKPTTDPIPAGAHVVTLQFVGTAKNQAFAEIDWLRVGIPDEDASTFAPPTLRDLVIDAVMQDRPRKALALRAPGAARCMIPVREGMVLRLLLGYSGPGGAEAEVRLSEPGQAPIVLQTAKIGSEGDAPKDVQVRLDAFAGKLVGLELAVTKSAPGGRVLFGEPAVVTRRLSSPPRTPARGAVVIVFSSADRDHMPPYADVPALATMADMGASSVVFRKHRAPTAVVAGSVASLVTGLAPQAHTVMDAGARLPGAVRNAGERGAGWTGTDRDVHGQPIDVSCLRV